MIVLRPNRSTDWRQIKLILAVLAIPLAIIALGWAWVGVWIVLPFAGLELLLLSFLMYRVNWQGYQQQVLTITPQDLILEQGYRTVQRHTYARIQCYITVTETEGHWQLPVCCLHAEQQSHPLGDFLNLADRRELCTLLHQHGLRVCRNRWWQP